jgi:hypothetical protein
MVGLAFEPVAVVLEQYKAATWGGWALTAHFGLAAATPTGRENWA